MSRKPNNEPLSAEAMLVEAKKKRASSQLYKAENQQVNNEAISKTIRNAAAQIKQAENTTRVNLDNAEMVKAITGAYLEACAVESCFPSMTGVSMALGHTRRNIYYYMKKKPDTETGMFLAQVHDLLADILSENALKGNANNITSIFLLKSLYGLRETDNIAIEVSNAQEDDTMNESDDYKQKYRNLIPE